MYIFCIPLVTTEAAFVTSVLTVFATEIVSFFITAASCFTVSAALPNVDSILFPVLPNVDFLQGIKSHRKPIYTAESGHRTSTLLHCGNAALKLNRKLTWNCKDENFVNDPEADKFRKREMREKWSYAKICPDYTY